VSHATNTNSTESLLPCLSNHSLADETPDLEAITGNNTHTEEIPHQVTHRSTKQSCQYHVPVSFHSSLSLWKGVRLVSVDLRLLGKHAAWHWRDSHHASGCVLPRRLLQRREHSFLFGWVTLYLRTSSGHFPLHYRYVTAVVSTLFHLKGCYSLFTLLAHLVSALLLFCVPVLYMLDNTWLLHLMSFSRSPFPSLHPYSGNFRPYVWVHARVLPGQGLRGHRVCGFRYGTYVFNSIQFVVYSPISQITNLPQRALQSVHIRHPWPLTSHRTRKNSQKIEKNFSETFRRATEEDPSPGWTEAIYVTFTEGIISELQQIQWVWQSVWTTIQTSMIHEMCSMCVNVTQIGSSHPLSQFLLIDKENIGCVQTLLLLFFL